MIIDDLVWDPAVLDKLERKHHVTGAEVESVFFDGRPHIRRFGAVYQAFGRTSEGRYLFVVFIRVGGGKIRPITARDMEPMERRRYGRR